MQTTVSIIIKNCTDASSPFPIYHRSHVQISVLHQAPITFAQSSVQGIDQKGLKTIVNFCNTCFEGLRCKKREEGNTAAALMVLTTRNDIQPRIWYAHRKRKTTSFVLYSLRFTINLEIKSSRRKLIGMAL